MRAKACSTRARTLRWAALCSSFQQGSSVWLFSRIRWEQFLEHRRREAGEKATAQGDHAAAIHALRERQAALEKPAFELIRQETGIHPFIEDGGAAEFAMGVPVYVGMNLYGVICPVASRVAAIRDCLAPLVVFVASERERRRTAAHARPGQRIEVLDGGLAAVPPPRQPTGQDPLPLPGGEDASGPDADRYSRRDRMNP
ncbi:hypothetical protein ACFYO5_35965 [Streptomyces sp. NPDC006259]|uniref:hypothetical protein n=1 Tax=Streptomyces sp. NPDC006259 TaxID=3364740 RepID=UPI0036830C19